MTGREEDEAAAAWAESGVADVADAMANLRNKPSLKGSSLAARKAREDVEHGPAIDGRRQRYKGRTEQLNVKVRPEFKKLLAKVAKAKLTSMAEVIEWAVEQYAGDVGIDGKTPGGQG